MPFKGKPSTITDFHKSVGKTARTITTYWDKFYELLSQPDAVDYDQLAQQFPNASDASIRRHLKDFINYAPEYLQKVIGFYPAPETILQLVESELGQIQGSNVLAVNTRCKEIIDSITKPKHEKFLTDLLQSYTDNTNLVNIDRSILSNLLYEEYNSFIADAGNGIMSIAGSLNEKILHRALDAEGLVASQDYIKTGTDKKGDIQIQTNSARHSEPLFCEVKSYNARERLLRGLTDLQGKKMIGVGFFKNPNEFNPNRTTTLLQTNPLAIYMPDTTLAQVHSDSLSRVTSENNLLYRPLTSFPEDMSHFHQQGQLPAFRSR